MCKYLSLLNAFGYTYALRVNLFKPVSLPYVCVCVCVPYHTYVYSTYVSPDLSHMNLIKLYYSHVHLC